MSDSENEYEALREINIARKRALFAELGLGNLANEFQRTFGSTQEDRKVRKPVQRKVVKDAPPSRRSQRIQKKCRKVKYVKGFLGFESYFASLECTDSNEVKNEAASKFPKCVQEEKIKIQFGWHSKFSVGSKEKQCNLGSDSIEGEEAVINKFSVECEHYDKLVEGQGGEEKSGECCENKSEEPCSNGCKSEIHERENVLPSKNRSVFDVNVTTSKNTRCIDKKYCAKNGSYELIKPEIAVSDSNHLENISVNEENNMPEESDRKLMEITKTYNFLDKPWYARSEKICLEIIKNNNQESPEHEHENSDSDDDWSKYEQILFVLSTSEDSDENSDSDDSQMQVSKTNGYCDGSDSNRPRKRISHLHHSSRVPTLSCEDVTEEMIANIAKRSSGKVYDQLNGTTCHQCRQKTRDTKTVCRSGRCVGVRGMFCGICLLKRYGEVVAEALKNPSWECPVCRGICNCSFCRARAGKFPTGIMYPEARQNGYNCVAEYLKDKENKRQKERRIKVVVNAGLDIINNKE